VVLNVHNGITPFQKAAQPSQSSRKVAADRVQRSQFDLTTLESKQIDLSVWRGFLKNGRFKLDAVVLVVCDGIASFQKAAQPSQSSRKVAAGRV